jgi:2-methylcitrate dehydratase PrpD
MTAVVLVIGAAIAHADETPREIDPESTDDITLVLARLAVETKADEITPEAYRAAKVAVLDAIGCAMAGYKASGVPAVVEVTKQFGGREEATIWFHGGKVPGPAATFANSVQTHALDLDDFHSPSITHITSVIVPAAFAMGELNDATGKETLASIVLGIEVAGRLGRACRGLHAHQGFLPTSVMGGFGATGTACRMQGCSVDETVHAMGIWYAHCSGNRQALFDRTLTKRIQPAIAARAGVFSSYLARKGFTGPRRIIAGQTASVVPIYGLHRKGPKPTVGRVMEPHDFFEVEQLAYKRYASCGASHYAIQAALDLANEHHLGVPWTYGETPQAMAQFCAPYEVASVIKNGRFGPAEIEPKRIAMTKRSMPWHDVASCAHGRIGEGRSRHSRLCVSSSKTVAPWRLREANKACFRPLQTHTNNWSRSSSTT